jgi:uncharacterized protein
MSGENEMNDQCPETRFTRFPPEVRESPYPGAPLRIWGYAAAFNKPSRKLGGFVELIAPTAFNAGKGEGWPDVTCCWDLQRRVLLGTTFSRTLQLGVDETGLMYEVEPPASLAYVVDYVKRGDLRHCQFTFTVPSEDGDVWALNEFGFPQRTIRRADLIHVGPALVPEFLDDDAAAARALRGAAVSLARHVCADVAEVREKLAEGKAAEFFKHTPGGS